MASLGVSRTRGFTLLLAALVVATGCASGSRAASDASRLQARAAYERALTHMRDHQPPQALSALREAVALDPSVASYHNTLGLLFLQLQRPDLALAEFRDATRLDPAFADARLNLGIALAEAGRWQEAADAYRAALALPTLSSPAAAHQNLGLALYHLRRYRESEESLRFALALDPAMEAAHYNLGLLFLAQGRRDEARAAFRKTREMAPQSPFGQAASEQLKALGDGG